MFPVIITLPALITCCPLPCRRKIGFCSGALGAAGAAGLLQVIVALLAAGTAGATGAGAGAGADVVVVCPKADTEKLHSSVEMNIFIFFPSQIVELLPLRETPSEHTKEASVEV